MQISCVPSPGKRFAWMVLVPIGLWLGAGPSHGDAFDKAMDTALTIQDGRRVTQSKVERFDDQTQTLLERYRVAVKQVADLEAQNRRLEESIDAQLEDIASIENQIAGIEVTQREIYPQMQAMLLWLGDLADQDLPFLLDEREARLAGLKDLLDDPEAQLAEQLGRLLEAYSTELDYGRNLAAWRAALPYDPDGRVVELLRVGRIGLFYLGLDGQTVGRWDNRARAWEQLDKRHAAAVRHGLRLARKQVAPSLLTLPMPTAGPAGSKLETQAAGSTQ